jgi:hypothetical protein
LKLANAWEPQLSLMMWQNPLGCLCGKVMESYSSPSTLATAENGAFQPLAEDRQRIKVLSVCLPALFILSLYGFLLLLLFFNSSFF